ncbi:MAG: tetratricopeptide repeat protein [bacterium]|nr:tetratricopeptide repeat protein [bacterium]
MKPARLSKTAAAGLILLAAACGPKKEPAEGFRTATEESPAAAVSVPAPRWTKTIALNRQETGSDAERALFDEFGSSVADRLRGFRVPRWSRGMRAGAADVKADLLLDCGVRISGDTAIWNLNLVDPASRRSVWNESLRIPVEEFERAAGTAAERAAALAGDSGDVPDREAVSGFTDKSLFLVYLRARTAGASGTRQGIDSAVRDYKAVLRQDSTFSPAWRGLGRAYLDITRFGLDRNRVWPELAKDAALRALRIDSTDGRARTLLCRIEAERGDFRAAVREAKRAVADKPNDSEAWILLGQVEGQGLAVYSPAIDAFRRGLELDPGSVEAASGLAVLLTGSGRAKEATDVLKRGLVLAPESPMLRTVFSLTRLYAGELDEARAEIGKALSSAGEDPFVRVIHAMLLARSGEKDAALGEVTLRVEPYAGNMASLHVSIAAVYALLGRNGTAVESLEKALSFGYIDYPWLSFDPHFDGLRGDSRFIDCMKRLKTAWEEVSRPENQT